MCLTLEVLLPALVVMMMKTERGGRVRSMGVWVRVCASREAARAGWRGPRVGYRTGPGPCAWITKERALRLSAGAAQGGVEVTVLAAEGHGLERRGRWGRGKGGGKVAFGQPLGVCDGGGGRGGDGRGRGKGPQGTVLFEHSAVLAGFVCSLNNM